MNQFEQEQETPVPIQRIDEARTQAGGASACAARETSCQAVVRSARSCSAGGALWREPHAEDTDAVEAYATVGEISDAMRKVLGEYRETMVI